MLGSNYWRIACAVIIVLVSVSCASNEPGGTPATDHGSPAAAGNLPGLPADPYMNPEAIRQTNLLVPLQRGGLSVSARNENSTEFGSDLFLRSDDSGLGWAIYEFWPTVDQSPYSIEVQLTAGKTRQPLYVAVSDYGNGRWSWFPVNNDKNTVVTFQLDKNAALESPSGKVYVVLATYGASSSYIKQVSLLTDEALPSPANLQISHGGSNDGIMLTWTNPDQTYAPTPGKPFSYDDIAVFRTGAIGGPVERIATLPHETASYLDPSTDLDSVTLSMEPHATYYYWVQLEKDGVLSPRKGGWLGGERGTLPVANFTITPDQGSGYLDVKLDASLSSDDSFPFQQTLNQAGPLFYQWDLDGDGVADVSSQVDANGLGDRKKKLTRSFDLSVPNEVGLRVEDVYGNLSDWTYQSFGAGAVPALQDDPGHVEPNETVTGTSGNYHLDFYFNVNFGTPGYKVELDTWYDGHFGSDHGLDAYVVKDFGDAPSGGGPMALLNVPVPAAQGDGMYYFALRVTDQSNPPKVRMLKWIPVELKP